MSNAFFNRREGVAILEVKDVHVVAGGAQLVGKGDEAPCQALGVGRGSAGCARIDTPPAGSDIGPNGNPKV